MLNQFPEIAAAPKLCRFVNAVASEFPLISGKLKQYTSELVKTTPDYLQNADGIIELAQDVCGATGWGESALREYYAEFVVDYLREQSQFLATGSYSRENEATTSVIDEVYHNDEYMRSYMMGLLASYAIFPHHYKQYKFYVDRFEPTLPSNGACIEFGVGHGMFMTHLLKRQKGRTGFGFDLSDMALTIARAVASIDKIDPSRLTLGNADVASMPLTGEYIAMTAAGLLEHINDPVGFLRRVREHLAPEVGRIFFMVPVNTAHADHVVHLETVDDCRHLMLEGGLDLVEEEIAPTENLDLDELYRRKIPIIYLGIYKRGA